MSFGKVKDSSVFSGHSRDCGDPGGRDLGDPSGHRPGYPFVHEAGLTDSWRNIAITLQPRRSRPALQTFRGLNLSPMPTCLKLDKSRSWHVEGPSCPGHTVCAKRTDRFPSRRFGKNLRKGEPAAQITLSDRF